ncbi:pyridoxine 4-dehydrogenase [Malassezia yamatoensis]|uniref:Pyridoxine 4-dehydrogenase n=1 Tax=Malassezia yamatoensis TaxID=253288 RepID=A0AAJ5YYU2_9BASI|nr:pyridoxine 4-dehydrogenase [Malassezia yamatoensis]
MSERIATRQLGGDAKAISVGAIGFGLMSFTWVAPERKLSDEQAFPLLLEAIEQGATYWNSATFYGSDDPWANVKLLGRFFEKYPEHIEKVTIGIKGGFNPTNNLSNSESTEENFRRELKELKALLKNKPVDIYGPARRDTRVPMEESTAILAKLCKEGLFRHIGLSEVSADSIRAAAKVHPIATVEVEYSPFSMDMENNGVLQACKENDIAILGYSPLSRGFFSGEVRKRSDIPQGDMRLMLDRFNEENFDSNVQLTDKVIELAKSISVTPTQLTLAWELHRYKKLIPIPGTSKKANLLQNLKSGSLLVPSEILAKFDQIADELNAKVAGSRYNHHMNSSLEQ